MKLKLLLSFLFTWLCFTIGNTQTNAPSIQTGVTFQWSDVQTASTDSATIQSVTVNGIVYLNFGLPVGYEMTQLGPEGHNHNKIIQNGTTVENKSSNTTWNASALTAFQDLNLNHYFNSTKNGESICDSFINESTTTAQRQTLNYGSGILATSSGVIAVTERNANNCFHLELFGIPLGGGAEQSLGETFINETSDQKGFGGTGTGGPNGLGTPGALNPPNTNSDYWLSDRVLENKGTIGIALFYLDDIAPNGSLITKAQLTASTVDHGDGKLFIFTLDDEDKDGLSDVDDLDDDNDGIKDIDESGGVDPSADHDVDGVPNSQDPDFCTLGALGFCENMDADGDGIPNYLDLDSDNDGIPDVIESGGFDVDNDGEADGAIGITPTTIGIPSSAGTGTSPVNTDNTGDFDFLDIDSDDDGIPDNVEAQLTVGYIAPSLVIDANTGLYDNYGTGLPLTDTDSDGTPDYLDLDSDNDGTPDIEENGMANAIGGSDADADGLDDVFETTNINDAIIDVNEAIENPSDLSVLPDTDGDLNTGGDLDYRDYFNINPPSSATIDFDGVDDYLAGESLLNGLGEVTLMAWVKIDASNAGVSNITIAGEGISCRLYVDNGNRLLFGTRTTAGFTSVVNGISVNYDEWHHVTGTFSGTTGAQTIYIDGKKKTASVNATQIGQTFLGTSSWTGNFEVGRMSRTSSDMQYFNGEIDEVRVFNTALTEDQVHRLVYQEITNNSGHVRGTVIPKDIVDISTGTKVSWNNLIAYYPMTDIKTNTTLDYSGNNKTLTLNNINTVQDQTAPMPYVSIADGAWTTENTWLYGDVWDIEDTPNNKDWSIVKISNEVSANHTIKNIGLIIESGEKLTVQNDNLVENSWYLELNGTLDLEDDSQLIQTETSDLVSSAEGKILRRQEGTSSPYWYNYWSSPVGVLGASSLIDNNAVTANPNNSAFSLNMLKDESGFDMQFISGYTGSGNISTYWLYSFKNGITYWDWAQVSTATPLQPGVGYTQKGTGTAAPEQQYIFEGKPNNGTILIDVADVGGLGSVANVSKTSFLLGNPYPSALDVHKFIDDNEGVIKGSLLLWQQWSGTSHNLSEYNGGYAQVNKTGTIRASQFVGIEGSHTGGLEGTETPTRYLPVGQGFMAEIEDDGVLPFSGTVEFNNSQRVFIKESNGGPLASVFSKTEKGKSSEEASSKNNTTADVMQKIRLEFNSTSGPETRHELLLGFSNYTTDAYDYGYDAENNEASNNNLNLDLEGKNMNIQAYSSITKDKVLSLNFSSSGDNAFEIKISDIVNIDNAQVIYLRDNFTGTYFNLKEEIAYSFSSGQGIFNERFELVFQNEQETLSTEVSAITENHVYFQNKTNTLFVKKLTGDVSKLSLVNMQGQIVLEMANVSKEKLDSGLQFNTMSTGAYVIWMRTDTNEVLTKKVIIK